MENFDLVVLQILVLACLTDYLILKYNWNTWVMEHAHPIGHIGAPICLMILWHVWPLEFFRGPGHSVITCLLIWLFVKSREIVHNLRADINDFSSDLNQHLHNLRGHLGICIIALVVLGIILNVRGTFGAKEAATWISLPFPS